MPAPEGAGVHACLAGSAFADQSAGRSPNEFTFGLGFRIIDDVFLEYMENTHPLYVEGRYSRRVLKGFRLDLFCLLGCGGKSTKSSGTSETTILLFIEPDFGVSYHFFGNSAKICPYIGLGYKFFTGWLKNNNSYSVNFTDSTFGPYGSAGVIIPLGGCDLVIEGSYCYLPVTFGSIEGDVGGFGLAVKLRF